MQGVKDARGLYEVERWTCYAARPGFCIVELQISPVFVQLMNIGRIT